MHLNKETHHRFRTPTPHSRKFTTAWISFLGRIGKKGPKTPRCSTSGPTENGFSKFSGVGGGRKLAVRNTRNLEKLEKIILGLQPLPPTL